MPEHFTGNELFDAVAKECYATLTQREQYANFYKNIAVIEIQVPKALPDISKCENYRGQTSAVDLSAVGVERVAIAAIDEALLSLPANSGGSGGSKPSTANASEQTPKGELLTAINVYFENIASRLSIYRKGLENIKTIQTAGSDQSTM